MYKHKLFGLVALGMTPGLSLEQAQFVPGTNPGFLLIEAQLVPGTNPAFPWD